jgi:hypothetical protein
MSIGNSKKPLHRAAGAAGAGASQPGAANAGAANPGTPKPAAPRADAGAPSASAKQSGRVRFDERGNAVWEWSVATGAFGREVSTERLQRLENSALSLAEDAPTPSQQVKANPLGTVKGYNPYDSGKLGKAAEAPKKKDLRKLSDWLKLKKQAANNDPDSE